MSPRNPTNDVDIQYFSLFSLFNLLMQLNVEREFAEEQKTNDKVRTDARIDSLRNSRTSARRTSTCCC